MKLTKQEREWLRLSAKVNRMEREIEAVRSQRRSLKTHILHHYGYRGARDELLTGLIQQKVSEDAQAIRGS